MRRYLAHPDDKGHVFDEFGFLLSPGAAYRGGGMPWGRCGTFHAPTQAYRGAAERLKKRGVAEQSDGLAIVPLYKTSGRYQGGV